MPLYKYISSLNVIFILFTTFVKLGFCDSKYCSEDPISHFLELFLVLSKKDLKIEV